MPNNTFEDFKKFLDNFPEKFESFNLDINLNECTITVTIHYSKTFTASLGKFICTSDDLFRTYNELAIFLKERVR